MSKIRLYISGPMTGIPEFNFPAFDRMAEFLEGAGMESISPADHDREVLRREFGLGRTVYAFVHDVPGYDVGDVEAYSKHTGAVHDLLVWDIAQIVEADGIVLLPGWEHSTGAAHERYVAEATNKRIFIATFHDDGSISMSVDDQLERLTVRPKYAQRLEDSLHADIGRGWLDAQTPVDELPESIHWIDRPERSLSPGENTALDMGEVRVVNEATGGAKGSKLARFDLIPAGPLWALAEHYGRGAAKYAARNWELGYDWSLSFAAMMRHAWAFWNGEDNDPELGSSHLDAVMFHAMSLREWSLTHPELDDRPTTLAQRAA